jgi:hypothetical protein
MSIRHDIVQALKANLEKIVAGYQVTLPDGAYTCSSSPKTVTIWKKTPWSNAQIPAIGIWDTDQTRDEGGVIGLQNWRLAVSIVGFVSANAPAEAVRTLQDDIIAVIGSDPRLGGLAVWCNIPEVKMVVDDSGSDIIGGCEIVLDIQYRSPLWRV